MPGQAFVLGVLGGDEKLLARCIVRAMAGRQVERVAVLANKGETRGLDTFKEAVEGLLGARFDLVELDDGGFYGFFHTTRSLVAEAARRGLEVVVCLGGSARHLAAATVLGILAVPADLRERARVTVSVDVDRPQPGYIDVDVSAVMALASLTEREARVLEALWRLGPSGPTAISRLTGYPKSTVHKILKKLVSHGIVGRLEGGAYVALFPPEVRPL